MSVSVCPSFTFLATITSFGATFYIHLNKLLLWWVSSTLAILALNICSKLENPLSIVDSVGWWQATKWYHVCRPPGGLSLHRLEIKSIFYRNIEIYLWQDTNPSMLPCKINHRSQFSSFEFFCFFLLLETERWWLCSLTGQGVVTEETSSELIMFVEVNTDKWEGDWRGY